MSRRSMVHAVLAAASLLGVTAAGDANAQTAFSIDVRRAPEATAASTRPVCDLANEALDHRARGGSLAEEVPQRRRPGLA